MIYSRTATVVCQGQGVTSWACYPSQGRCLPEVYHKGDERSKSRGGHRQSAEHCPAQTPGVAEADVVDPAADGGADLFQGQFSCRVGRQQPLEPAVVGDALTSL